MSRLPVDEGEMARPPTISTDPLTEASVIVGGVTVTLLSEFPIGLSVKSRSPPSATIVRLLFRVGLYKEYALRAN
jgi:hypothetical protein